MMQVSSFISNFKRIYKKTLIVIEIVAFISALLIINRILSFLLISDSSSYTRVTLHELYGQDNIDVLFLGSSHCYRSLDPAITDEIFEANTFNAGTSSQNLDGSYTLLVEAGKNNNLQRVYVEMYYSIAGTTYKERTEMTSTYIISDYMHPSLNRFFYLINAGAPECLINSFIPARRNWYKIFDGMYVINTVSSKLEDSYRRFEYPVGTGEYYAGKGYVASTEQLKGGFSNKGHYGEIPANIFSEDDLKYLDKIINYCRKNNIEVTFFTAPMPDFRLVDIGNYDEYISQMNEFTAKYDVEYFDFNLCKKNYFSYQSDYFKDNSHLNALGAEKFSKIFANFFNGNISEEDLFYSSYAEKADEQGMQMYGIIYSVEEDEGEKRIILEPVCSKEKAVYATVLKKAEDEENYEEVQVMQPLEDIVIPEGEKGELHIHCYSDQKSEKRKNEIVIPY